MTFLLVLQLKSQRGRKHLSGTEMRRTLSTSLLTCKRGKRGAGALVPRRSGAEPSAPEQPGPLAHRQRRATAEAGCPQSRAERARELQITPEGGTNLQELNL